MKTIMTHNDAVPQEKRVPSKNFCCKKHSEQHPSKSSKKQSSYWVLFFLVLLFAAPGMMALGIYQYPTLLKAPKVNKGTLLNPPMQIVDLPGKGQWRTVYWGGDACDDNCLKTLDILARMRLALGRHLYEVDQWVFLDEDSLSVTTQEAIHKLGFQVFYPTVQQKSVFASSLNDARVFVADPNNYFILSYPKIVNPNDIYKDLKLLLNTSQNQKGSMNAK